MKRNNFTLIEMLAVITIILLLTALAATGGIKALRSKAIKACKLQLNSIEQAIDLSFEEKGFLPYADLGNSNYDWEHRIFLNNFSEEAQSVLIKSQADREAWGTNFFLTDPFGEPYTYFVSGRHSSGNPDAYPNGLPAVYSKGVDQDASYSRLALKGYGAAIDVDNIWAGSPNSEVVNSNVLN